MLNNSGGKGTIIDLYQCPFIVILGEQIVKTHYLGLFFGILWKLLYLCGQKRSN